MHLPLLNNTLIRLMGTASENCAQTQTALKKVTKVTQKFKLQQIKIFQPFFSRKNGKNCEHLLRKMVNLVYRCKVTARMTHF